MKSLNIGSLFNRFPRNIGTPRQIPVQNWEDFIAYLNLYNGKTRFFCSLYPTGSPTMVDKLWFDFDGLNHYENIKKYHNLLVEMDMMHSVVMSGGGFHLYIFNKPFKCVNSDQLAQAKTPLVDRLGLEGYGEESFKDIRRVVGVPGTKNTRRGFFVRSLTSELINSNIDAIMDVCRFPSLSLYVYGGVLYDPHVKEQTTFHPEPLNIQINKTEDQIIEDALKIMTSVPNKFEFRYSLILYMMENLHTPEEIMDRIEKVDPSRDRRTLNDRWRQIKDIYKKRFEYNVSNEFFRMIGSVKS